MKAGFDFSVNSDRRRKKYRYISQRKAGDVKVYFVMESSEERGLLQHEHQKEIL